MCGRFSLTKEEAEIEKRFNARFYSNDLMKRYNVAPGQLALVITNEKPGELQLYKWGLVPSWAKEASIGYKMINARSETIFEKPSFKRLIEKKRCLVISDGFYEWQPDTAGKQPYRIGLKDDNLFAFAGLWDSWTDRDSGELIHTFTIITTDANNMVSKIHNRMPVILPETAERTWIEKPLSRDALTQLMQPFPERLMKAYKVSRLVNSASNDTKEIIEPLTE